MTGAKAEFNRAFVGPNFAAWLASPAPSHSQREDASMTTARGGNPGDYDTGQAMPYVDSRIYTEHGIFEEELEKIWKQVWLACVHESEIPDALDFRTLTIARQPIVIVRGP